MTSRHAAVAVTYIWQMKEVSRLLDGRSGRHLSSVADVTAHAGHPADVVANYRAEHGGQWKVIKPVQGRKI